MDRSKCLDTAKTMVCGHREEDYGKPENNFQVIADLWNAYLNNAKVYDIEKTNLEDKSMNLSAMDVAVMMALFKIGRITSGTATDDSFVDACGYLACGAEIKSGGPEIKWDHITKDFVKLFKEDKKNEED